jgi:hypothetical protein
MSRHPELTKKSWEESQKAPKVGYNLPDIEKLIFKVADKNLSCQISISRALYEMLPFADKDMEEFLLSNPHLYCGGGTERWGANLYKAISPNILQEGVYGIKFKGKKITVHKYEIEHKYKRLPIHYFEGVGMTSGRTLVQNVSELLQ